MSQLLAGCTQVGGSSTVYQATARAVFFTLFRLWSLLCPMAVCKKIFLELVLVLCAYPTHTLSVYYAA